jgi:hypothetical protein
MSFVLGIAFLGLAVMAWQHFRYLRIRRYSVQDKQPMFYGSDTFHAITFLKINKDDEVLAALGSMAGEIVAGAGKVIYAGQVALTNSSEQISVSDWDGVIMAQYPSRQSYEKTTERPEYRSVMAGFQKTYTHGMIRLAFWNLIFPQTMLAMRVRNLFKRKWNAEALIPATPSEISERAHAKSQSGGPNIPETLLKMRKVNDKAIVIVNLQKPGSEKERAMEKEYSSHMMLRFAQLAHGPMHFGQAVMLEGEAEFESASLVYYPGPAYFAELWASKFFQGIMDRKQLADNQSVVTLPVLSKLEGF